MYFTDTEIMDSTIENMYIEQNLLLWSSRGGVDDIPEFIRRPKPSFRQPLAPDLSLQQEEVKHGEYATHILLQKQTREYASAVEDSILLLKRGTEEMVKCLTDWKGSPEFMRDYKNFPHDGKCFDELTHIGKEVLFMSETIKNLHNENAVAFWTSGYREAIFRRLISFSKDIVKLRRKLGRIKNSLKERVGSIRKVVLKYGIETGVVENLVPPGIYHEWVKEDMNMLEETDNQQQGQGTGKSKMKAESVRKIMNNVITNYFDDPYGDSEESVDCNDSSSANITAFKSLYQRKYQMRKDIEILHKEDRSKNVTESSFEGVLGHLEIPPSSSNPLVVSTKESSRLEIKSWVGTLSPSNIVLETIASNINPSIHYKHKSNQIEKVMENEDTELSEAAIWHQLTSEHEDDVKTILPKGNNEELVNTSDVTEQQSSCIHVVPTQNHNVISVGEETKTMGIPLENNENIVAASVSFKDKPQVADECLVNLDTKETTVIFASDSILKEYESFNEDGSTAYPPSTARAEATDDCVLSSGTPSEVPVTKTFPVPKTLPPASELVTFSSCGTSSIKNSLSKSMAQQISTLKVTIENIHETAQQTTYSIREVERSWLNPSQHIIPNSRRQKELFQHLDFIVDTVVLLNKPSFASRLYKEDQYEIVAVLDPVFREVTTCYVTLCELHDRVMVDTKYLKQLVYGFPKGSLVIQDWVRDPIDDEDEVGQHQYASDLDVDVEELFA
ncbi:unnamed protein product [Orchesella dallaii]|uniref:Uncharacterized protein n=1 Tax=Orchesella dallaii TaxID=48710 RepID=A0ABP1QN36_9HEXA